MKHTEKTIAEALWNSYVQRVEYVVSNVYAFPYQYGETDFLVANKSGYCYDIEIKVTRADFKADFKKKRKHDILNTGGYKTKWFTSVPIPGSKKRKRIEKGERHEVKQRPNRFYYAVPEGMISVDELPDYAGLIYVSNEGLVTKVKEAKLLHKHKLNIEKLLCRKFYFRMINAENKLKICQKRKK